MSSNLFAGMHVAFLVKSHMSRMKQRIKQLGCIVDETITAATTHLVCPPTVKSSELRRVLPKAKPEVHSYKLVTPEFFSKSILNSRIQNEDGFRPKLILEGEPQMDDAPHLDKDHVNMGFLPPKPKRQRTDHLDVVHQQEAPPPKTPKRTRHKASTGQPESSEAVQASLPCVVERRGSEWVAVQGEIPRFTGGHTRIPWGSYGQWDEPFDQEAAIKTVEILRNHWYSTHEGSGSGSGASSSRLGVTNGVCTHRACSLRPYCLVSRLEEVKKAYLQGRGTDQYRIKAIDKAQQQLITHPKPLDTDADVEEIGLGAKSAAKVKEILWRGHSSKAEAAARDERTRVYAEFYKVWGVGASVAEKWYSTFDCRSLEDVRRKAITGELSLTAQQRVGLKYFDEFAQKIPREAVGQAEAIVREATFELVETLGGGCDVEKTYCYATGSYRRGSPESSDVDMLVILPPSLLDQNCGEFLQRLLAELLQRQLLVDEMYPLEKTQKDRVQRASWMGVCRTPGSKIHRRIDFKLYSNPSLACAVNYFANSQAFCRATRHWANTAGELAKKYHPSATGFKLSDIEFVPIKREKNAPGEGSIAGERGARRTTVVGPRIEVACETDIYEALGLSYVPVWMRYFHDYF